MTFLTALGLCIIHAAQIVSLGALLAIGYAIGKYILYKTCPKVVVI